MSLAQVFFELIRAVCENYHGLNPLNILDYPVTDVFNLINDTIEYNERNKNKNNNGDDYFINPKGEQVIRRKAVDWF